VFKYGCFVVCLLRRALFLSARKADFLVMCLRILKKIPVIVLTALLFLSGCSEKQTLPDSNAAEFLLQDINDNTVKLSDYRGNVVLLEFWATWCPPCRAAIPGIEKIHRKYKEKGLVVLAISLDKSDWNFVKSFLATYGVTYSVLKGTDDIPARYGVRSIPTTMIIDKTGKIAKRYVGFGSEEEFEKDIRALL